MIRKKIVAFALAASMILGGTQLAGATSYSESISEAENTKSEAQSNLESVNSQIAEIEYEQAILQEQIDSLDAELIEILIDIDTTKDDIARATVELEQTRTSLAEARATEEEQLNSMKERIVYMYENGDATLLSALFDSDSFAQVLNKLDAYETVYNFDRTLLAEYQATKLEVEDLVDEVAQQEAELEYDRMILEEQEQELEAEKAEKSYEMADFDVKLAEAEDMAAQYRSTITAMNEKIEELQEAQRIAEEEAAAAAAAAAAQAEAEAAAAAAAAASSSSSSSGSSSAVSTGSSNVSYSSTGQSVANYACQFVGNPYVWGGTSLTNGCDCSGFVMSVYANFGVSLPHSSSALRSVGTGVSVSDMMPGDIVCYSGHCGIYIGGGTIVNAIGSAYGIGYSSVYKKTILAVRRIFT